MFFKSNIGSIHYDIWCVCFLLKATFYISLKYRLISESTVVLYVAVIDN